MMDTGETKRERRGNEGETDEDEPLMNEKEEKKRNDPKGNAQKNWNWKIEHLERDQWTK